MISVGEAFDIVADALPRPETELVSLEAAGGRVLAADVAAGRNQPALDLSAMDGFAVSAAAGRSSWRVAGVAAAGDPQASLPEGESCIEIMTGAPLPEGADTVIPVEQVTREGRCVALQPDAGYRSGQHVRKAGSDYRQGATLLRRGERISSATVAVLAAEGMTSVPVQRPLRAAVLSTGTELVLPEHTPEPHQIRASNRAAIEAELHAAGLEVVPGRYSTDDEAELETAIRELADSVELLLLCGGVSRGRYDFIEATLEKLGARTLFHWVAQKPGKPLLCAEHSRGPTLILGLPGNPQSALIGARRYAVEAARRRPGAEGSATQRVVLAESIRFDKDKTLFQPAVLREGPNGPEAVPVHTTGSGDYFGLSRADGFLELPAQRNEFAAGERYPFYGWSCI